MTDPRLSIDALRNAIERQRVQQETIRQEANAIAKEREESRPESEVEQE